MAGGLCDQIHVQSKTTVYANPDFFGQPWYIPLVFGTGVAAAYLIAQPFAKKMYPSVPPAAKAMAIELVYFLAAYLISATFQPSRPTTTIVLYSAFGLRVLLAPNARALLAFAAIVGVGGTTIEIVLSALGSFHYAHPSFLGVPYWLPALYAHAAPLGLALTRRFPLY